MKKLFTLLVVFFAAISVYGQINAGMKILIKSPSNLGAQITCVSASFGGVLELDKEVCGEAVLANGLTSKELSCDSVTNNLTGKIALVKRGTCNFSTKCSFAEKAGAIAVIVINNAANAGAIGMAASTGPGIKNTIPAANISLEDGNKLIAAIAAGATVQLCMVKPSRSISEAFAADAIQIPFRQRDTIFPGLSVVNSSTDTVKNVNVNVAIKDPSGKVTNLSFAEDVPPTEAGFVNILRRSSISYYPALKGKYNVTFTNSFVPIDTFKTEFAITDSTFANDNGVVNTAGNGLALAQTSFLPSKISNIVAGYSIVTATKANFLQFGLANYNLLKDRIFSVEVYEGSDVVNTDIPGSTTSLGDLGTLVGDVIDYTVKGTEVKNSLVTIPLTDGGKPGISLEAGKTYLFAVTYNGTDYKDSIAPAYTGATKFNIRGGRADVGGTAIMTGTGYFSAGFSGNQGMILRVITDKFVQGVDVKDLATLDATEVAISPNPASNFLNVTLNLKEQPKDVQIGISDMTGRIMKVIPVGAVQSTVMPIDVSSFAPGTYFITIKTDKAFRPEKFVKVN